MEIKLYGIFLDEEATRCLVVNGHVLFDEEINEGMESTIPLFISEREASIFARERRMTRYYVSEFPKNNKYPDFKPAIVTLLPDDNWFLCEVSWAD